MAARLTEHVWTLREVMRCGVPPWPQPQALHGVGKKMIMERSRGGMPAHRPGELDEGLKSRREG